MDDFQKRISYQGNLEPLLEQVCNEFKLGEVKDFKVILSGYEDFNLKVTTVLGNYFVKIFSSFRDLADCQRYVEILEKCIEASITMPKLLQHELGNLFQTSIEGAEIRLIVMEFIEGEDFHQNRATEDDLKFLVSEAAKINQIDYQPSYYDDGWALVNLAKVYKEVKEFLLPADLKLVEEVAEEFTKISLDALPHCFVHGDIIRTNVIKSGEKIYVLDFAVANYYPRIIELALVLCNFAFDEDTPQTYKERYDLALSEYSKRIKLTEEEIRLLPLFVKAGFLMYIICPIKEAKIKGNETFENDYWLNLGRAGLKSLV